MVEFRNNKSWAIPRLRDEWQQFLLTIPDQFKNENHMNELITNKIELPTVQMPQYKVML
jgi:hypothetical protein